MDVHGKWKLLKQIHDTSRGVFRVATFTRLSLSKVNYLTVSSGSFVFPNYQLILIINFFKKLSLNSPVQNEGKPGWYRHLSVKTVDHGKNGVK